MLLKISSVKGRRLVEPEPEQVNVADWIRHLDVPFNPEDGDMITDVVILGRIMNANRNESQFYVGMNPTIDIITRMGLIAAGGMWEAGRKWENVDSDDD